ncbi:response regulator [Flagellimonas halotolerans]|uniref:histidine kinase n=1 Tax=Flagellimonas halotolerans TaxID=3112164 RepID=A0ABU6IV29_9FLAO|nr:MULTISPECIES: response regulator [unclassified Allomuricauda]MEC3966930.1 response regulator [Muricauda sp. SYSU M86414]MEC4266793.1 response regulator [Muricauda sp. SYSU M84420]
MTKDNQPLSILVIEDNPGDFMLIDDYLIEKFSAIRVIHKETFESAITDIKSFANIDIILLDLILPDLKGEQLVEKVQEVSGNIPIIILTGYSDIELARKILSKGVSDFLIKDEISPEIIYKSIIYALERKSYIAQLNKNKKIYQDLFDFSPQPMWVYDPDTLLFLGVNKAAVDKYGYTLEEFERMTIKDIRPRSQVKHLEKSLKDRKRDCSNHYAGEFEHLLKTGQEIRVEIYSSEIEYGDKIMRLILAKDITDKQEYIRTIEGHNRKLKDIAWTQSHVVRAPLARLLSIIHLLELDVVDPDDIPFLLNQIKGSGSELGKIIDDLNIESNSMNQTHTKHGEVSIAGR